MSGTTLRQQLASGVAEVQTEYQKFLTGHTSPTGSASGEGISPAADRQEQPSFGGLRSQSEIAVGQAAPDDTASSPDTGAKRGTADPWMAARGINGMSESQLESAQRSYARWAEEKPQLAEKHNFGDYVGFVQGKWTEKNQPTETQGAEQTSQIQAPKIEGPEIKAPDGQAQPAAGQVQAPSTEPQPSQVGAPAPQSPQTHTAPAQERSYVHEQEI